MLDEEQFVLDEEQLNASRGAILNLQMLDEEQIKSYCFSVN